MRWALLVAISACGRSGFDLIVRDGKSDDDATSLIDSSDSPSDVELRHRLGPRSLRRRVGHAHEHRRRRLQGVRAIEPDRALVWTAPVLLVHVQHLQQPRSWDSVLRVFDDAMNCTGTPTCRDDDCGSHERHAHARRRSPIVLVIDGWLDAARSSSTSRRTEFATAGP
jgi:hypothetical protein